MVRTACLLLWKHWTIFTRSPCFLAFCILFPLLITLAAIIGGGLCGLMEGLKESNATTGDDTSTEALLQTERAPGVPIGTTPEVLQGRLMREDFSLLFSPVDNIYINRALSRFSDYGVNLIGFNDPIDAEEYFIKNYKKKVIAIVEFEDNNPQNQTVPNNLKVVLRVPRQFNRWQYNDWNNFMTILERVSDYEKEDMEYSRTKNLARIKRQEAEDAGAAGGGGGTTEMVASTEELDEGSTTETPESVVKEVDQRLKRKLIDLLLFLFSIGLLPLFLALIWFMSNERICDLKDLMYSMGLKRGDYWISWYLLSICILIPIVIVMLLLLKYPWFPKFRPTILEHSNYLIPLTLLFVYIIAITAFACFLSEYFCDPALTMLIATFLYMLPVFLFLLRNKLKLDSTGFYVLCIFPPSALGVAFDSIVEYELMGDGVHWSNINKDFVLIGIAALLIQNVVFINAALAAEYLSMRWCHLSWILRSIVAVDPCICCAIWFGRRLCCEKCYNRWCSCPKKPSCKK